MRINSAIPTAAAACFSFNASGGFANPSFADPNTIAPEETIDILDPPLERSVHSMASRPNFF